ncbi:DNA glycosylase AlkZ-like family protein [Nocardia arizonensis]|uniref:DNA glycosylase AlkZ-like family protein n=1 Tax=Nocardia arizonensis TaxID=1141647 RepID=UPI0006CFC373|nr:crosslink repair DNA glycosylase YcaQ family protein [Nocardia arizonensis]
MRLTWDQVLAWRLDRHFVSTPAASVVDVAARLCGVQAQVTSAAETAVALRSAAPESGALVRELAAGTLVKTWSMRGTLHALTPAAAAAFLPLIASARIWEKAVWQRNFGATPQEVAALAEAVSELLAEAVLTRDELVEALAADSRFHGMGEQLRSGWGALLKPLAWQGVLCHGPAQGNRATFTSPAHLVPGWRELPDAESAARPAIMAYLAAYGPATPEAFDNWLSRKSLRATQVRRWFADIGDELTEVDIEGRRARIATAHADELAATPARPSVHLLGPFDQYILGPGTSDTALLPTAHRSKVSRTAGWISPLVLLDGRVAGTWELADNEVVVTAFDDTKIPTDLLDSAVARVAGALHMPDLAVRIA